jgi:anaerobic ribonucleoside-triphosphate reductase
MCCSLRLDMSKIMKSSGAFGANDNGGSIGVVTQNLALLGYLAQGDKNKLKQLIREHMYVSRNVLNSKREFIEKWHKLGMYPRLQQFITDFHSFFSTIGVAGQNEKCLNFLRLGIDTEEGTELSLEILDYMNEILAEFQELDKHWYNGKGIYWNLELTPLEGATRRLAQQMHKYYPEAITSNGSNKDYITRGCWLPVDKEYTLKFATEHQAKLQDKFSGGANFNYYLESPIDDWKVVRSIIRKIVNNTSLPFISISPSVNICPICGSRIKSGMKCEHELTKEEIEEYKKQGVEIIELI